MIPIVLHHGFWGVEFRAGPWNVVTNFHGVDRAIAARGHPLIVSRVHPTAGIETRARQLKESILRQLDILRRPRDEKVLLIGHSMGGLDARYMINKLGMASRVRALLTVTSPHHGTTYADWCVHHLGRRLGGIGLLKFLRLDMQAVMDLTTENCRRFNEEIPDHPDVRYFSVSAARPWHRVPAFALHAYKVVYDAEGDNDCLVSVKSSTWGEHLGTWPADHFHTITKRLVIELKDPTGDITPYYLSAIDEVMRRMGEPARPREISPVVA
jgi:triacylglycerol lipase